MKFWRLWWVLAAVTVGATGCASASDPAASALVVGSPVEITLWAWEGTGFDLVIPEFERENPAVVVNLRISAFDQHHEGLQAALEAGDAVPDLALIERAYMPEFATSPDHFTDLRDFGAGQFADDYLDWRWQEGLAANGAVLGFPTDVGGLAFAYRKDLFAAAGLPTEPAAVAALMDDWDGLLELATEFQASGTEARFFDSPDSIFLTRLGQEPTGYVHVDGSPAVQAHGVTEAWRLASTAALDELTAELTMFSPEWNDSMATGGFAVLAAPSWMRSYMAGVAPETAELWGLVPVPGKSGNWGGSSLTVPQAAQQTEVAYQLAQFLTSVDTQRKLFAQNGNFPSTPALFEQNEVRDLADPFFDGQTIGPIYIDSVATLPSQPAAEQRRALDQMFTDALGAVMSGNEVDDVWSQVQADALEVLESS